MSEYLKPHEKYVSTCPTCGEQSFYIVEFSYKTPYFGEILVISGKCSKCGYRYFDIVNLEEHEPVRFVLKVNDEVDASSLVVKSQTALIIIPELGVMIEPGPASQAYITTVEGILYKVLDVLELYKDENIEKYAKQRELLEKAIKGKIKFTLILEDNYGNSLLIPKRKESLDIVRLEGYKEFKQNHN